MLTSINTVMFVVSTTLPDSRRSDEPIRDIGEEEQRRRWGRPAATFSFQALDFYLGLGFEVFGEIKDHPEGGRRYFLSKRL